MTGFRSKRAMNQSYSSLSMPAASWRERLHQTYIRTVSKYGNGAWDNILSDCMDFMQSNYPGKYHTLKWIDGGLEPVFDEPKYETIWKIQYED